MTTYYTTAISGNAQKNKGGTILNAGNANTNLINNLTLANNAYKNGYGSRPILAVSPTQSGNLGIGKPLSGGVFASMEKGKYVGMIIGTRIAQTDNTTLAGGSADFARKSSLINAYYGDRRLNITSWAYATGVPTYGAGRGDLVTFGADEAAEPTDAVPGKLAMMEGGKNPVQEAYKARTSP